MKKIGGYITNAAVAILFAAAFFIFDITCPIRFLTGIPCPSCGMTRAVLSIIRLDLNSYFRYNAMALFVLSDIVLLHFEKRIKCKRLFYIYLTLTLLLNLVYYAYRLKAGTIL